jgi:GTPase SAR1 family protein
MRLCLSDQAWASFSLLDLEGNQIESLPQDCANLPDGMKLILSNNPLVAPPVDIATQGLARIKLWLSDRRTQQRRPLDRMRVCFVGYGGAGKTTFAKLLTDGAVATCAAVQDELPIRKWTSAQVDAWIRAGPIAATPAERQFLERLANALADIEPDGKFLVDFVSQWDAAVVLSNTSNAFTDIQVRRWWPRFQDRVLNHERKGYSSTVGIDVWELTLPGGLQVKIIDFAGQMEYYISHGMFVALRNALYVLVSKAAPKCNMSDCQIDEALYWVGYLRSSMSIVRVQGAGDGTAGSSFMRRNSSGPRRTSSQSENDAVARVLLAVTHTDAFEPKYEPAGLLHILGQRVDEHGEAANDPPSLIRPGVCVPRYDDPVTADEARSCLIRAIEEQVPVIVLFLRTHLLWSLGLGRAPALVRSPFSALIAAGCWSIYV